MQAFFGTFTNKIDAKGRLSVPAPFRAVISSRGLTSVALHPSLFETCLEGAGRDRFENLTLKQEDSFTRAGADDVADLIMGDLRDLALDGEGRIVLPDEFMAAAKLSTEAAFVGGGWKFQIWEPAAFNAAKAAKRAKVLKQNGGQA